MTLPAPILAFNWEEVAPIIVFLIVGVIQWLGARGKKQAEQADESAPRPVADDEAARRAREVMEEIRRRIAERKSQDRQEAREQTPSTLAPRTLGESQQNPMSMPHQARTQPPPMPAVEVVQGPSLVEQLATQQRRLQEARRAREEVSRQYQNTLSRDAAGTPPSVAAGDVRALLATPESLRAAFVASEILGKPLALRESEAL